MAVLHIEAQYTAGPWAPTLEASAAYDVIHLQLLLYISGTQQLKK
jgi:hypothetical protein